MHRKLRKAIVATLGMAALAAVSTQASANGVQTSLGTLTGAGLTGSGSTAFRAWDGNNNGNNGWRHNSDWFNFGVSSATDVNVTLTSPAGGLNPAFSVWAITGSGFLPTGIHSYDQVAGVGANSLVGLGGVTAFVGYANSGPAGWANGDGFQIGTGSGGAVTVGPNLATLVFSNLAAGNYLVAVGGSSHDNAQVGSDYSLSVTQASSVPIPAAVWLFGSALAGLGVFGRRKDKTV